MKRADGKTIFRKQPSGIALTLIILFIGLTLVLLLYPASVQALPEYTAQTGEPCATCRIRSIGWWASADRAGRPGWALANLAWRHPWPNRWNY